ncbi:hypothetical protein ACFPM7_08825 [Actinokineospora guangxiensis]|uniref:MarR family protein n=1 Tax=Actinokineospora guangxiensis TaxID=1490288 RepID=A0ABW0EMC0_9PSEU
MRNGSGHTAHYVIESKLTSVSNSNVINQLLAVRGTTELPVIFVTEYVNPALRAACQDNGFSYLDTTGWVHITHENPPLLIRLDGAQRPPRPRGNQATTRLNGPAAGRAIRTLLETTPPIGIRELAQLATSSPAAVSKVMPALASAGAVERDETGAVVRVRRRSLLERWTADYRFTSTNSVTFDYLAPRDCPTCWRG